MSVQSTTDFECLSCGADCGSLEGEHKCEMREGHAGISDAAEPPTVLVWRGWCEDCWEAQDRRRPADHACPHPWLV